MGKKNKREKAIEDLEEVRKEMQERNPSIPMSHPDSPIEKTIRHLRKLAREDKEEDE